MNANRTTKNSQIVASKIPFAAGIRVRLRAKPRFLSGILEWEARKLNCINRVYRSGDGNRTHARSSQAFAWTEGGSYGTSSCPVEKQSPSKNFGLRAYHAVAVTGTTRTQRN